MTPTPEQSGTPEAVHKARSDIYLEILSRFAIPEGQGVIAFIDDLERKLKLLQADKVNSARANQELMAQLMSAESALARGQSSESVGASVYESAVKGRQEFRQAYRDTKRALEAAQAKIDALMLEYCPDEMTPEQTANWGAHQVAAPTPSDAAEMREACAKVCDDMHENSVRKGLGGTNCGQAAAIRALPLPDTTGEKSLRDIAEADFCADQGVVPSMPVGKEVTAAKSREGE